MGVFHLRTSSYAEGWRSRVTFLPGLDMGLAATRQWNTRNAPQTLMTRPANLICDPIIRGRVWQWCPRRISSTTIPLFLGTGTKLLKVSGVGTGARPVLPPARTAEVPGTTCAGCKGGQWCRNANRVEPRTFFA